MSPKDNTSIFSYALALSILWSASIGTIAVWTISEEKNSTLNLATAEARAYFNKDQAMRLWATEHGRIYVPATDRYPPDPNLAHIPERDIETPSGIALTLINPARIIRELDQNYGHLYGVTGKVTSLTPLARENIPQACLRPRDRFWDIPVPKINSAFDNLFVPQPSWSPSTTQQLRKLVAAPYLAPI